MSQLIGKFLFSLRQNLPFPLQRPQRKSSQMNLQIIGHLQSCTPISLIRRRFMKVRLDLIFEHEHGSLHDLCLILPVTFEDHRWTFHSERVQPADFNNSPVNHLTELQSVSSQQLIPPYRFSSEPLPLHLDPQLGPLSVSPQVSSCVKNEQWY